MADEAFGSELDAYGAQLTDEILKEYKAAAEISYRCWRRAEKRTGSFEDAELIAMEGVLNTARIFSAAQLLCLEADPEYPMIVKMISLPSKDIGVPNSDCTYQQATVHGDHSYRIFGSRGTSRLFDVEVYSGRPPFDFKFIGSLDSLSYNIRPDSDLNIVLSQERRQGVWLPLPEGIATLFIRQVYYDWDNEKPGMMVIEREGATYPPPRLTRERFEERVAAARRYLRDVTAAMHGGAGAETALVGDGTSVPQMPKGEGAYAPFTMCRGYYTCKQGEALILKFKPPKTDYWNVHLWNLQGDGLQTHLRQVSINGHQAAIDNDGYFRAVISRQDPGVKNWLDSHDREFGLVFARFYKVDPAPQISLKRMSVHTLENHLPEDTLYVMPEERMEIIRRRLISVHHRLQTDY